MNPTLILRADADLHIGTGHVMRMLALAAAWRLRHGRIVFVTRSVHRELESRIRASVDEFVELEHTSTPPSEADIVRDLCRRQDAVAAVVLDGYHFDIDYQRAVRDGSSLVAVVDDFNHLPEYSADVLVNQNVDADTLPYRTGPETVRLLGCRYALLRPEFWRQRRLFARESSRSTTRVMLTMGGVDRHRVTGRLLEAIATSESYRGQALEVWAVIGPSNPQWSSIDDQFGEQEGIRLFRNVVNMTEVVAGCDLAITAGGSTCWELAYAGVPMAVVVLEENQRLIAEGLQRRGAGISLGWHADVSGERVARVLDDLVMDERRRRALADCAARLVDGHGAFRVARTLKDL